MQRRIRKLKVMPNGDVVARPQSAIPFSPVRKHPTTSDLCRPVGIDGYRRTLMLPSSPVRAPACGRSRVHACQPTLLLQPCHTHMAAALPRCRVAAL